MTYDNNQRVLQTGFEYTNSLHNLHKSHHFQLYNREAQFKQKRTYTTLVLSLYTTGQTGLHGDSHVDTGQTGPPDRSDRSQQNRGATHSAYRCATRQPSSQGSRSTTSHPSASRRMNLIQQGQKSMSGCPEIHFWVATTLSN